MSIAEQSFKRSYGKFKEEKYPFYTILFNLLPKFTEEVSEAWGYDPISIDCISAPNETVSGSRVLFQYETPDFKIIIITEDGRCYKAKLNHEKAGGITWNGDDVYRDNYRSWYSDCKELAVIENIKEMDGDTELTIELLEQTAAEIVSVLLQ